MGTVPLPAAGSVSLPEESNLRVPDAPVMSDGVPALPLVRSSPGTEVEYFQEPEPLLVKVTVTTCLVPSESTTSTGAEKVLPLSEPAFRLRSADMFEVALGGKSAFTGTERLPGAPAVLTTPLAAVQPCTFCPVAVSRLPEESSWKLPARV